MNLYWILAYGHYAHGIAVILAGDEPTARVFAARIRPEHFHTVRYNQPHEVHELLIGISTEDSGVVRHWEWGE